MEGFTDQFVRITAQFIELLAALIVGYGTVVAFYNVVIKSILHQTSHGQYEKARINLGQKLAVGLEFELGADLLQTAISPTWNHIGILGAIIVIRTILNFVLERDIMRSEEHMIREQHIQSQ
ncbi:MAG: DUF1622 domain-containing protein [Armatimonadota bacterium]